MTQDQKFEIPQELRQLAEENVERARQLYLQFMDVVGQAVGARKAVDDDPRSNIPASGTIPRCRRRVTRNSQLNPYDEGRES